ncbi:MAG: methyltransferase [Bacteroidales bacterium]|nr:methyltransferase [Bacteroidales bacterium]
MHRKDSFQYKQFTIQQRHAAMKVGTDSDLLGALAAGGTRILDVGTGTGVISLMLAQRYPEATITAVEIDDDAIIDAHSNFAASPWADRIMLVHSSFQDYLARCRAAGATGAFDCVVCNPPYFDKSLECPDGGRTRARHSSSLPFAVLAEGAYAMLGSEGVFSVCIPGEVLADFSAACFLQGFWLKDVYQIKTLPHKPAKRFVLVFSKGAPTTRVDHTHCMRTAEGGRSEWYLQLMEPFHVGSSAIKKMNNGKY